MLGVGVETTYTPEVVLDYGRRLELYLADPTSAAGVRNRIKDVFLKSYNAGMFHVSVTVKFLFRSCVGSNFATTLEILLIKTVRVICLT